MGPNKQGRRNVQVPDHQAEELTTRPAPTLRGLGLWSSPEQGRSAEPRPEAWPSKVRANTFPPGVGAVASSRDLKALAVSTQQEKTRTAAESGQGSGDTELHTDRVLLLRRHCSDDLFLWGCIG